MKKLILATLLSVCVAAHAADNSNFGLTGGVNNIANGGTGASTAAGALTNLGAAPAPLTAVSASLGGVALLAGACSTTATTVAGATTSMAVFATPTTFPGAGNLWNSYVSAANTVTTEICAIIAATPVASTYQIRVLK